MAREVNKAAFAAAQAIRRMKPGPLADMRRMETPNGAPGFWRLAAQHPDTIGRKALQNEWIAILRIMAILTPKGDPDTRGDVKHRQPLGRVLCDGGDQDWGRGETDRQPIISETRLAQLLAKRGPHMAVTLERTLRGVARKLPAEVQVEPQDIAWTVLNPARTDFIARTYYTRLDGADATAKEETPT